MTGSKIKHFLVLLIIAGTVLSIFYLLQSKPEAPVKPEQETTWTVNVLPLQYAQRSPELNILGTVESVQNTVISSRVNTTVTATPVLAGNQVSKGDVILAMDPLEVGVLLTQRQADVAELTALIEEEKLVHKTNQSNLQAEQNLLRLAEKALTRQQRLARNNVTSQERLDNAEVALQQQKLVLATRQLSVATHQNRLSQLTARLDRAQAQLQLAELDMAQTELLAPFDGWVVSVRIAAGNRVRPGEPLIELVASNSLEVRAQIPDRWVPVVQTILASKDNPEDQFKPAAYADFFGETIELSLVRLAASASSGTGGVDAYFHPKEGNPLLLGKSVSLHVILPALPDAYALPVSAVYGYDRIYLVDDEMRLQAATIDRLGRYQSTDGGEWIIFAGENLSPGRQVITTQLPNAISGLKIVIRQ